MKKYNNLPDIRKAVTIDYDAAGRLTNVQYPSGISEACTYDRTGNRITLTNSITGTTYTKILIVPFSDK